jgi:phosphate transport system substrate-binding protein
MNKMNFRLLSLLAMPLLALACNSKPSKDTVGAQKPDTLSIWVDTSLGVIANEQKKAFENIYNSPVISLVYRNEADIIQALMNNQVNCAILQRKLSEGEVAYLQKKEEFLPKQYVFGHDAYACISSRENPLESISVVELKNYFLKQNPGNFSIAVENSSCQTVQFLKSRFSLSNEQLGLAFANNNFVELLDYLRSNPKAIGIIPFSYIADIEAASTVKFLESLKVMPVKYTDSIGKTQVFRPSQETITTREYAWVTPMVLVNCNMEKKSGTNFVNYIFKPKAQRLILKCGLSPAIFPGREVNINTN